MTFDARGRTKYFLNRPCLDSGALVLNRSLQSILPSAGTITFVLAGGEELPATVDAVGGRVLGLREYFSKYKLAVNDTLVLTALGERRYSLEHVTRLREERIQAPKPVLPPPPKRIVVEETNYVREVREVREPKVSPYPKGLIYPNANNVETSSEAETEASKENPRGTTPLRANPTPASRARASLERALLKDHSQPAQKPILTGSAHKPDQSKPKAAPERPQPQAANSLERVQAAFVALGYATDRIEAGDPRTGFAGGLMLTANMGARSHRVALAVIDAESADLQQPRLRTTFEVGKRAEAKYFALVASSAALQTIQPAGTDLVEFKLARVDVAALEQLLEVTRLAPIGPLDLEGYWNAGALSLEAVEALEANATDNLSARGAFSFVTLSLSKHQAPCMLTPAHVMKGLESSGVTLSTVKEVLDTLCRAPFMLLLNLGNGEYYLRQDMPAALEGLTEYANGLRQRLRAPDLTRNEALPVNLAQADSPE